MFVGNNGPLKHTGHNLTLLLSNVLLSSQCSRLRTDYALPGLVCANTGASIDRSILAGIIDSLLDDQKLLQSDNTHVSFQYTDYMNCMQLMHSIILAHACNCHARCIVSTLHVLWNCMHQACNTAC